ncbi:MAG: F0F1 ATP synthase subunit delta [Patescibacteria group bacterium]
MRLTPTNYAKLYLSLIQGEASAHLSNLTNKFWALVFRKKHFGWRGKIIAEIMRLWYEQNDIVPVAVTTGRLLGPKFITALRKTLTTSLNREVDLQVTVKPHLLAGLTVQVGDKKYDASLKGRLDQLYSKLAGE